MVEPTRRVFLKQAGAAALVSSTLSAAPRVAGEKIKVGQIGVGHAHAAGKMHSYRSSADYEVVGVVEPDPKKRAQAMKSATYRDLPWMTREELLNIPGLRAVAVETEVKDSLENAQICVDAGLHIHLDKPAGSSLSAFRRVLESATKQKRVVQMGYMYRYNPAVLQLRRALREGWLGDVFEVHTVMSKVVSPAARAGLAQYPGGMMFELGCHIMDLVIGVLGAPTKVQPFTQHASSIKDPLQDNMLAVLEYPRAIATVKSSAMEVHGFSRRHFVACGSGGTFHIEPLDAPASRIALAKAQGGLKSGYQDVEYPRFTRYVADAADLAKIIREEKASDYPPEHDLAVQRAVLEACGLPTS